MLSEIKSKIRHKMPIWSIDIYRRIKTSAPKRLILSRNNLKFKGIHKHKKCFILCNGSSINKQNLLPLKNEIVFSVSNGYYHKDYLTIQPKYHCVPRVSYGKHVAIDWFKEMDAGIGTAELFLDAAEESLVRKNNLFSGRKVNYLNMGISFSDKFLKIIDISRTIPGPQSVVIMCLMIAMYMGFDKIFLIGTEHDSAKIGEYKYFYTPKLLRGKDPTVNFNGKVKNIKSERMAINNLMKQYGIIKRIAENNRISIYNATLGGILELYPRVSLSEVLK